MGSNVTIMLEICAQFSNGVADRFVRTVNENSKSLKFINQGFESE